MGQLKCGKKNQKETVETFGKHNEGRKLRGFGTRGSY